MNYLNLSHLAVVGQPLFGNQWLALLVILAGVAVFMVLVALVGRALAAGHPDAAAAKPASQASSKAASTAPAAAGDISPEVRAVIAASVFAAFGGSARIAAAYAENEKPANIETLMAQWALEGRREIYSSHRIR